MMFVMPLGSSALTQVLTQVLMFHPLRNPQFGEEERRLQLWYGRPWRKSGDHPLSAEGRSFGDENGLFSKTVHELAIIPPNDVPIVKYHLNDCLITFPLT